LKAEAVVRSEYGEIDCEYLEFKNPFFSDSPPYKKQILAPYQLMPLQIQPVQ
jgi:hypothetical protein